MKTSYEDLKYLEIPLPENILKEKWRGNFDRVRELIHYNLGTEISEALRKRLQLELGTLDSLARRYTVPREAAISMIREYIPELTEEEFDRYHLEGKMEWIYLHGEVRYLSSFCRTLLKAYPEIRERAGLDVGSDFSTLKEFASGLVDGQETVCHIHIRAELGLADEAVEEGKTIRVHLPVPVERDQVKNLRILGTIPEPKRWPQEITAQPCLYFEEKAETEQVFSVEYAFDHVVNYVDLSRADLEEIAQTPLSAEVLPFLEEKPPHIVFTPYLKALAAEIKGEETNPLVIARRIYDYITSHIQYQFARDYGSIDSLAEYCALNRKGDCGIQALLFITLCRICGIPAKWQSGLDTKPGDLGEHDWARFFIPSMGWVCVDLSYGGAARKCGEYALWNYFFGNADPYRIPINDDFQVEFDPPKKFRRQDPYDNQCGEIEYEDHGVYGSDYFSRYCEIDIHRKK